MQAKNLSGGQELICINVDKVYDWIVKEKSFDVNLPTGTVITFTGLPAGTSLAGATLKCEVVPNTAAPGPVEILEREDRPFIIDGTPVTLQQLNIRKNFVITFYLTLASGVVFTSTTPTATGPNAGLLVSRCEQVTMCAPVGTDIEIVYTDLDCFLCTFTLPATSGDGTVTLAAPLTLSIVTCQSIQSTFPVTVEFLAEFCEPRDDLPTECPAPVRPLQCPVIFP